MKKRILVADLVRLRPLERADIGGILRYVRAQEIADNTFVPQPYTAEDAQEFVQKAQDGWTFDDGYVFALIDRSSGCFAGCMGIHPIRMHDRAEVGYWLGKPFWGRGLATAALRRLIQFGFEVLKLNRIEAGHFPHNPASGRVMLKAKMRYEGLRRDYVLHRDAHKDLVWYAILRVDYEADRQESLANKKKETAED